MISKPSDEKVKPFKLVKYFTFTSLILIFLGILILAGFNNHWSRMMQLKKSEDYARLLVANLNHQVYMKFYLPLSITRHRVIRLSEEKYYKRMDMIVKSTLHSFNVEKVNIYDKNNTIIYSYDQKLIGSDNVGGKGYLSALSGASTSKLIQRGNFFQILLGFPQDVKLITFAPLRTEEPLPTLTRQVFGVFEIVQDISEDFKTIFRFQILAIITITLIMGALFLALFFVVKRGEAIIENRARERLRLKEQLTKAQHLSSLGEMVAGVSHEIRNPLGIIRSSAALLKKKMNHFDPSSAIPDIIIEESDRLNNIITDFLSFAKPKMPNLAPCRVEEVLDRNITFLASQIEKQGYIINKHYDSNLPEIMADSAMLYQAFLNILINSMQAMPGGGKIDIQLTSKDNSVTITFEDEGEGMPEDVMEKIWEPFFTTKEKGTGLGLGIVKNIIEMHNGTIHIDNRSARGARIAVKLPVKQGI
ncbi:MAG: two-component sensor histidine kinase [Proteobacteria bacterium]|nr:two-component sensor histidine kinase [Pseudomonadota bacterium]